MSSQLSELHDLADRWFTAWLKKDAAMVEQLAADDYVYVGPSGWVVDRAAVLAVIRSPSYRLDHAHRSEITVRALGPDAAVVRHRYQGAGSYDGKAFSDDQRCVMIWHRESGGRWRLVMDQCSFAGK